MIFFQVPPEPKTAEMLSGENPLKGPNKTSSGNCGLSHWSIFDWLVAVHHKHQPLHHKINPKDCQVLSLGDLGFLQIFRVVSSDYSKPRWLMVFFSWHPRQIAFHKTFSQVESVHFVEQKSPTVALLEGLKHYHP